MEKTEVKIDYNTPPYGSKDIPSNCIFCETVIKSRELIYHKVYYCAKCLEYLKFVPNKVCCDSPKIRLVKTFRVDKKVILYNQCKNCGFRTQGAVKQDKILELDKIDMVDEEAMINRKSNINKEINDFTTKFIEHQVYVSLNHTDPYYSSEEWNVRRKMVFRRDGDICQCCLSATSTQIHHLSYEHFRNEPLFDLVSVCQPCHEKITLMDKKNKNVPQIPLDCF